VARQRCRARVHAARALHVAEVAENLGHEEWARPRDGRSAGFGGGAGDDFSLCAEGENSG